MAKNGLARQHTPTAEQGRQRRSAAGRGGDRAVGRDQRPETAMLQQLQTLANDSLRVQQLRRLQALAQGPERSAEAEPTATQAEIAKPKPNLTGLPERLKSNLEALSGLSMDAVRVHYNSTKPAQLNDVGLEREADVMGARAISAGEVQGSAIEVHVIHSNSKSIAHDIPTQLFRERKQDESWQSYGNSLMKEAKEILEKTQNSIKAKYLQEYIDAVQDSQKKQVFVYHAAMNLKNAIEKPMLYFLENLSGDLAKLTNQDISLIEKRIDAFNNGEKKAFGGHAVGVGGLPTMDVTGTSLGGHGRGNLRLQFYADGKLKLVDHDNKEQI
ncbi:MAG: hypothetical protein ACKN89_07430 [Cyanobium sp.]